MIRYALAFSALFSTALMADAYHLGVGTQLGLHGAVPVAGLEVTVPVSEQMQFSSAFVQGKTSLADDVDQSVVNYVTRADFALSEASVSLRWLMTSSFYVGGGLGYRTFDLDIGGRDFWDNSTVDGRLQSQALQAKILIGNTWTFGNGFYLGADWIGVGVPLAVTQSKLSATETFPNQSQRTTLTEENDPEYRKTADRISQSTMGTLLTLRLGFQF